MASIFLKLTPASQRALITAHDYLPPEHANNIENPLSYRLLNGCNPVDRFEDIRFAMHHACTGGFTETVREILNLGASANEPYRHLLPLAVLRDETNGLEVADLLLSFGANPNHLIANSAGFMNISPMHGCCNQPDVLQKLIAHGGDVSLTASCGRSVLEYWRWVAHSPQDKAARSRCLRGLEVMLSNGLDPQQSFKDGASFLTSCWGSGFLRRHTAYFMALGFDPYQHGRGAKGASLFEHLQRKARSGKGGELAARILSDLNNRSLEAATPKVLRSNARQRL
jgi:hypothetical protein